MRTRTRQDFGGYDLKTKTQISVSIDVTQDFDGCDPKIKIRISVSIDVTQDLIDFTQDYNQLGFQFEIDFAQDADQLQVDFSFNRLRSKLRSLTSVDSDSDFSGLGLQRTQTRTSADSDSDFSGLRLQWTSLNIAQLHSRLHSTDIRHSRLYQDWIKTSHSHRKIRPARPFFQWSLLISGSSSPA